MAVTLNTGHALYADIISCAPFYDTPNVAQRVDIAPGAGGTISLTKWTGHANGVEGPEASGIETSATIDTSGQASGYLQYSIGVVFDMVTTPGFGTSGDNFLAQASGFGLKVFNGNLYGRMEGGITAAYAVANGSSSVVAVITYDNNQSTTGTVRLYVDGTMRASTTTFPTGTKPTSINSRWDATNGSMVKRLEVMWKRTLSDAEVTSWSAAPYDIIASGGGGGGGLRHNRAIVIL